MFGRARKQQEWVINKHAEQIFALQFEVRKILRLVDELSSYMHGRCLNTQPALFNDLGTVTCLLMFGHDGKHSDGQAFWWEVAAPTEQINS